jgi:hypothetical protein
MRVTVRRSGAGGGLDAGPDGQRSNVAIIATASGERCASKGAERVAECQPLLISTFAVPSPVA